MAVWIIEELLDDFTPLYGFSDFCKELSYRVLFTTLGSEMLSAASDNLFAQVTIMDLARPAEDMIIITNLLMNQKYGNRNFDIPADTI